MAIEGRKEKMRRYSQNTGELPINDATRMELLIAMCPNALEDVIRSWPLTNKSVTHGVWEQLIFDKFQPNAPEWYDDYSNPWVFDGDGELAADSFGKAPKGGTKQNTNKKGAGKGQKGRWWQGRGAWEGPEIFEGHRLPHV